MPPMPASEQETISPPPTKKRKLESTTTKTAVASFFTPVSQKEPEKVSWTTFGESLLFARYRPTSAKDNGAPQRTKIAAFDLDSTLITTKSGAVFGKDATDWKWWHPNVPGELRNAYEQGHAICILTNQGGLNLRNDPKTIKSGQRSVATFKQKVSAVLNHFDFPILLLASTEHDKYRKPRAGMWNEALEEFGLDGHRALELDKSFFVGDAGGRPGKGNTRGDHSSSDRDMASNIGVNFLTPEEHFLKEPPLPFSRNFEPSDFLTDKVSVSNERSPLAYEKQGPLDIVMMCGSPGSGKSTFYWSTLKPLGYERVNQDTLKTRDKCLKVAATLLSEQKPVAVDNTNADVETRAVWVRLARKHNIPIRCVYFTAPAKLCQHNDSVRALAQQSHFNPENRTILPAAAFVGFAARFKEPKVTEGFADITPVEFERRTSPDLEPILDISIIFDDAIVLPDRLKTWNKTWRQEKAHVKQSMLQIRQMVSCMPLSSPPRAR